MGNMNEDLDIDDPPEMAEDSVANRNESPEEMVEERMAVINVNSYSVEPSEEAEDDDDDDLEQSLQALEKLDRSSPDLWPEQGIPGVNQFLPSTPAHGSQGVEGGDVVGGQTEYLQNLSREDLETLMQLGSLTVPQLMGEVKRLQNIAYQLGQEETKEMTRGKYLNILRRRTNQ